MEIKQWSCPNCGGTLNLDDTEIQTQCPYCGVNLILDYGSQTAKIITEKEKSRRRRETEKEKTERKRLRYEYLEKQTKYSFKIAGLLFAILFVLTLGYSVAGYVNSLLRKNNDEIRLSISSDDLVGESYTDVKLILENNGFENIKLEEDDDLIFGIINKEGAVESVTINGYSEFEEGEWF